MLKLKLKFFNLVELILIIAVLISLFSLLNPALTKLVQRSEDLQCINNLTYIHKSIVMYSDDNNGILPGPVWYGQKAHILTTKMPKFNNLSEYLVPYFEAPLVSEAGIKYNPVFTCPTNTSFNLSKPFYSRVVFRTNYIKNFGIPFGRKANNQKPKNINSIPHNIGFLLQDADDINYPYYPNELPDVPVHSNLTRNTLFADGRVEGLDVNLIEIDP